MNSINWPSPSEWVFIAQLVEHCSAKAEATGSNPLKPPKTLLRNVLLKLPFNCDGHIFISLCVQLVIPDGGRVKGICHAAILI